MLHLVLEIIGKIKGANQTEQLLIICLFSQTNLNLSHLI